MEKLSESLSEYEPLESRKRRIIENTLEEEGIWLTDAFYVSDMSEKKDRLLIGLGMYADKNHRVQAQDVSDLLSAVYKRKIRLSSSENRWIDSIEKVFMYVEEAEFIALNGYSRAVKDNEEMSGDNYSVMESEDGIARFILSDGTGSGDEASSDSTKVLDLMEKMLDTGYDPEMALQMLNTAFFTAGRELNHPTLDMCEIDLHSGECNILKSGAAVSFLKRGEQVEIIGGESLPLGYMRNADIVRRKLKMTGGDYLIMMTDGVLDALNAHEYENTMKDIISTLRDENPKDMAGKLIQTVLCLSSGRIRDDMTVLVAGIYKRVT
jgi:stage II sporulation protein E